MERASVTGVVGSYRQANLVLRWDVLPTWPLTAERYDSQRSRLAAGHSDPQHVPAVAVWSAEIVSDVPATVVSYIARSQYQREGGRGTSPTR